MWAPRGHSAMPGDSYKIVPVAPSIQRVETRDVVQHSLCPGQQRVIQTPNANSVELEKLSSRGFVVVMVKLILLIIFKMKHGGKVICPRSLSC